MAVDHAPATAVLPVVDEEAAPNGTPDHPHAGTQAARLAMRGPASPVPASAWRKTVGCFEGDADIEAVFDAGRRVRDAERHPE